jgi:arylsulfatase A-like enzyme
LVTADHSPGAAARRRGTAPSALAAVALLGSAALLCGCDGEQARAAEPLARAGVLESVPLPPQPDVLFVTVDTLRPDFLSCYGFPRTTTPAIDALAAAGTLFALHRTTISLTLPAHATLFTGLQPSEHGVRANAQPLPPDDRVLAERFRAAGYRTAAAVGSTVLTRERGLDRGFDVYDDEMPPDAAQVGRRGLERSATAVLDTARAWLADDDPRPLFLWVHLFDPHEPYRAAPEFVAAAADSRAFHEQQLEPSALVSNRRQLEWRLGYEAEVREVDRALERFLADWDARPRGPSSLVVFTSDHGQGLGEHDYSGHGFRVYEEQLRVPLILRCPGRVPRGGRVAVDTSAVDLCATVVELAGLPEESPLHGASLVPLLRGDRGAAAAVRSRPIQAERRRWSPADVERIREVQTLLEHQAGRPGATPHDQYVWIEGGAKYIWSEGAEHEFYDLRRDPREARNLIRERAAQVGRWREALEDRRAAMRPAPGGDEDPVLDPVTRANLEALGY